MKTAQELEKAVITKASEDTDFRAQLLSNPTEAIQQAMGVTIHESFTIKVHEEDSRTAHLVLPPTGKLSSTDLSAVAGGDHALGENYG